MREVHIMIGVPGSGKSTFARRLPGGYISPDLIRQELTGEKLDQSMNAAVFEQMYKDIDHMMSRGDSFVIDATNANYIHRLELLTYVNDPKRIEEMIPGTIIRPKTGEKISAEIPYIKESKRYQIVGWYIDVSFRDAVINNEERPADERVPVTVIANMFTQLEENPPSLDEGFDALYRIKVERS